MPKWFRYAALALVLALILAGLCHTLHREETCAGSSGAALGLMLLEKEKGVYVLAVTQDSLADQAGIAPGDYLLRVNGMPLRDAAQLDALIDQAEELQVELYRQNADVQLVLPIR